MQKYRFFLNIVFLFLIACNSNSWSNAEHDIVDLVIREDALHFSNGFSIALIEGATPEKTKTRSQTTVVWKKGEVELGLQFSELDPEVQLIANFTVSPKTLASISGRLTSDKVVTTNFGGKELETSRTVLRSTSGSGTLSIDNLMQLYLPFLYSVQRSEAATRWRYVDDLDLPCELSGSQSKGYLRVGLPRVDVLHRDPRLSGQLVVLLSSDEELGEAVLTQKINTIMKGHSESTDPRFGNGGLAIAQGTSTFIGKNFGEIANLSFVSSDELDCKPNLLRHINGESNMLFLPGVGHVVRSESQTSRIFRSASLESMKVSGQSSIVHLNMDETLVVKEGADWTLSERSALDFADLELFGEEGKVEVLGATDFAKRLVGLRKVSWRWSPDGRLTFRCLECVSIPDFMVRIDDSKDLKLPVTPASYKSNLDVHSWNFTGKEFVVELPNYRPKGMAWRFASEK